MADCSSQLNFVMKARKTKTQYILPSGDVQKVSVTWNYAW